MVPRRSIIFTAFLVAVLAGTSGSGLAISAAQDTGTAEPSMPAFIVAGDCSNFDANPVGTLNNAMPIGTQDDDDDDDDSSAREVKGSLTASPVLKSESEDIEVAFDDLLAESHSVTIHLSQDDVQTVVACGNVGGVVEDDELTIAIHEVDGSGYNGIAQISKEGDDKVDVTLYVAGPEESESDGTPVA